MKRLRPVTTDDLMKRREELYELCGAHASAIDLEWNLDIAEEYSYMRELHYVDSVLTERMVQARYSNNKVGASVFISHSSADKQFANWLGTDLKAAGHSPWLDEWEIRVGESIPRKVSDGIRDADFVVVVLTESAVASHWVEREWQNKYWDEVSAGTIQVLPALYKDCSIPELLKTKRYADFRNSYNRGLDDLLAALDSLAA